MLKELAETTDAPRVIVCYSAISFDELGIEDHLRRHGLASIPVPLLTDSDIDSLIDARPRPVVSGRSQGRTARSIPAVQARAQRQLLVALLEATSGVRFEEKIAQECEALAPDLALGYAIVVLATSQRYPYVGTTYSRPYPIFRRPDWKLPIACYASIFSSRGLMAHWLLGTLWWRARR